MSGRIQLDVDAIENVVAGKQLKDAFSKSRVVVVFQSVPVEEEACLIELSSSRKKRF